MTFQEFLNTRKNINLHLRIRNIVSLTICSLLGYQVLKVLPNIYGLMIGVTLALCSSILIVKLRNFTTERKYNKELMDYIKSVIKEARLNLNYTTLNELLNSKYASYTILGMSQYPSHSFNFAELSKWENLPKAIKYFQENDFKEEDLKDSTKMITYMKTVVPHFFK